MGKDERERVCVEWTREWGRMRQSECVCGVERGVEGCVCVQGVEGVRKGRGGGRKECVRGISGRKTRMVCVVLREGVDREGRGADVSSKTGQNGSVRFCRKVSFDLFSKVEKDSVH